MKDILVMEMSNLEPWRFSPQEIAVGGRKASRFLILIDWREGVTERLPLHFDDWITNQPIKSISS
jgi:hypothetical protein